MKVTINSPDDPNDFAEYEVDEQYRGDLQSWLTWAVKHSSPQTVNAQETINRAREKTGTQLQFGYQEFQ